MNLVRILKILLCVFLFTGFAAAQFTLVSATVTDPNGTPYAGGTVSAQLVTAGVTPTLNGLSFSMTSGPASLNAAGSFTMSLVSNTAMVPSTLQWQFTVCSSAGTILPAGGLGPVCFTSLITITGATQSITATLDAAAPKLSNPPAGGSTTFATLLPGTSTSGPFNCGTGCSFTTSGSGAIGATTVPFAGVAAGANAAALTEATGGSFSPSGIGQVVDSQEWGNAGIGSGVVNVVGLNTVLSTTGGSLNAATQFLVGWENSALGSTYPTAQAQVSMTTCGGGACSIVISEPQPVYSGMLTWSVASSQTSGGPYLGVSGCTAVPVATTTCTMTTNGAGGTAPTANTAFLQPPNVQATQCAGGVIPFGFTENYLGQFFASIGVDPSSNNGRTSGTLEFCEGFYVTDRQTPPLQGDNALVVFDHNVGTNTSASNQDRTAWFGSTNPIGDSATRYGIENIQGQITVNGHPTWLGNPDSETTGITMTLADQTDASYGSGTPAGGSNTMRLTYVREPAAGGTGLGSGGGIFVGMSNGYSSAAPAGTILYGADLTWGGGGTATNLQGIGLNIGFPNTAQLFGTANYGITFGQSNIVGSNRPAVNATTYGVVNFITGLPFSFNGPTTQWSIGNSNPGSFPVYASMSDQGSITVTQVSGAVQSGNGTCSGGASTYQYNIITVDGNGGTNPGTAQNTAATCTNPLTSGNPATINPNLTAIQIESAFRFDVYRTGGPMALGKIGSLTCVTNGVAPTCNSFVDTGLTASGTVPTTNTTGSASANQYFTTTNCNSTASTTSPAACGSASTGVILTAAAATSFTVNTSTVTANSRFWFSFDTHTTNCTTAPADIATLLQPYTSAVVAGTSFTMTFPVAPTVTGVCVEYGFMN